LLLFYQAVRFLRDRTYLFFGLMLIVFTQTTYAIFSARTIFRIDLILIKKTQISRLVRHLASDLLSIEPLIYIYISITYVTAKTQSLQASPVVHPDPGLEFLSSLYYPDVEPIHKVYHILHFCALASLFEEDSKG